MASTKNSITSELNNFIRHEIEAIRKLSSAPKKNSPPGVSATIPPKAVVRHAADQLVESLLRDDITAAAAKLTEGKRAVDGSELLREAESLLESSACQLVEDILRGCNAKSFDVSSETNADIDGSGSEPKKSKALGDASSPAPISFSLFDLMDSNQGFVIPPRITAHQIINAYQRETNANSLSAERNTAEYDGDTNTACEHSEANGVDQDNSTALELLEKADDIEDLSPDPDSWETVRKILYNGLTTFIRSDDDITRASDQSRFLKVHKSLHEKCLRSNVGSVLTTQLWGIAQNIVGALLLFDQQFESFAAATTGVAENDASISFSMDLYWDLGKQFLECLSHLASDYVQSCVGNENEIERMMLGIGLILQRSSVCCLLAAMDPMAGWFEVWSRFLPPSKLMAVVKVSGLGRDLLQRCNPSKNNVGVQKIADTLSMTTNKIAKEGSQDSNTSSFYDDLIHCQLLQSISVLRTIILQCGGSPDIVHLILGQAVDWYGGNEEDIIFCQKNRLVKSCDYCLSLDDAQTILKSAENHLGQCERDGYLTTVCVDEILKPFLQVLKLAKSHPGTVDASVESLCSETVDILQRLQ
mmetsp:Transcript_5993/g.13126  ORF Transcript_5993/g.13126 Transcript_5993/m.13126 type:complete len:588 (-) Transcript_5993:85-1848(-)